MCGEAADGEGYCYESWDLVLELVDDINQDGPDWWLVSGQSLWCSVCAGKAEGVVGHGA